jgi:transposase-like protein
MLFDKRHDCSQSQVIPKGQTRFDGFDDKILSLYARGMTVREIPGHLAEDFSAGVESRGRRHPRSAFQPTTAP